MYSLVPVCSAHKMFHVKHLFLKKQGNRCKKQEARKKVRNTDLTNKLSISYSDL